MSDNMAIGLVLITTLPDAEDKVRTSLDNLALVTNRCMLFAEYDIIARVQADH